MALFVFGLIVALCAGIAILVGVFSHNSETRLGAIGGGAAGLIVAVLFIVGSFYNSIPARSVGVPITFGKIGKPHQSGIAWAAPWTSYTVCPLTEETDIQNQDPNTGSGHYDQAVRIAGSDQGGAQADVTVQYHIDPVDAQKVYSKFKCDLSKIHDNLIVQRVRSDVASAAAQYLSTDLKTNRAAMEGIAEKALQADLGHFGITVDDLVISTITLDPNVQNAANAKLAAQQNALTQEFNLQAAQKQAQINATKQQSLTAAILCEQFIQAISQSKITVLNTAGPCGGSVAGGGTGVIVNGG